MSFTPSAGDATTSAKGLVRLTGDLAGTANSPTVPGLASKADDSNAVHKSGDESISGIKTFTTPLPVTTSTTTAGVITANNTSATAGSSTGVRVVTTASGQSVLDSNVPGDAFQRMRIDHDEITFGPGSAARDFGLQRLASNLGQIIGVIRTLFVQIASAGRIIDGKVDGESLSRVVLDTDAVMFGSGTATRDTGFKRTGTGTADLVGTVRHAVLPQTVKATGFTFSLTDAGVLMLVDVDGATPAGSTPTAAHIPLESSVAFPIGTSLSVLQVGTNQLSVTTQSGVTLHTTGSTRTRAQWSILQVDKIGSNEWVLSGDTE
ncbi:MAG: hypothetical protein ACOH18_03180 [Candidatus Saccharimonadaceae bacterium]